MATKAVVLNQNGRASPQTEEADDSLRQRLATAEEGTQQLMLQLEEMGFNTKFGGESSSVRSLSFKMKDSVSHSLDQGNFNTSYNLRKSSHQSQIQEYGKDPYQQQRQDLLNPCSTAKGHSTRSSKHRPVTPFSLQGMAISGLYNEQEAKSSGIHAPKRSSGLEIGSKNQLRSGMLEEKAGQQQLDKELIRVKKHMSQLEDELQYEMEGKKKAREEVEKLQNALDDITTARAELEMKVEELMMDKQKTNRRLSELKELASRETNLRSSLEESHTTLLSRLQDMESVIESLRGECKRHSDSSNDLKSEMITLKDELAQETTKRQRLEDSYHILVTEKDKLLLNASSSQSENQRVLHELTCLQAQFADLIGQLEQTQQLVENLSTSKRTLEEEKAALLSRVQTLTAEFDKMKCLYTDTKESETKLTAEKSALEDDFSKLKTEKENLVKDNTERKRKIDVLEQELKTVKQSLAEKNLEFISAADSLELELTGVKRQLEAMENEKQRVLKDKESLLEEVNQTVDMLMSERSRLQTEVQASCVEAESLRVTCSRLELDKAQLLEKLGGLQQQQAAQCKVEVALNEMVEQKNKLAYENGKLRSTVSRLQQEISEVTRDQADITQLRRLTESLQAKYTKSQREISEYKISLQRLEGQSKMALEELEQKDHQLKVVQNRRDEVEREMGKLLGQIEDLEGRQLHKVTRYEKNMEEAKNVNKEIAGTLEAVMTSHTQLQSIVENLQVELGKRDSQISQLKNSRNKEHEEMKQEMRNYEEKVESLKQELKRERDKTGKKTFRELAEIRKQNENFSSRNQDLIKANSELRQKVGNLEREKNEMKAKLSGQKHKLVYLYKAKKQLEENLNKMKAVREDIEELEQVREEYMQKNKEQGETITNFITQISSLQDDLRQLASAHSNTQHLLKRKEEALEKEQKIRDEMSKKYTECKKREEELFKKSHDSDEKLKEVHSESLEISKHLEEAQDWFKGQFDKLLTELTVSRQIQAKLEMGNSDQRKSLEMEKSRAHNAAERAKEMIQSSRKTIMELSDYARMADLHARKHLSHHQDGLQAPTWTSKLTLKDLET